MTPDDWATVFLWSVIGFIAGWTTSNTLRRKAVIPVVVCVLAWAAYLLYIGWSIRKLF